MSTLTQRRPRVKPTRTVRLDLAPSADGPGVLTITVGKAVNRYYLERLAADFGESFRFTKFGPDAGEGQYHVHLNGERTSCECKGFLHWNHCKHVEALAALRQHGQL